MPTIEILETGEVQVTFFDEDGSLLLLEVFDDMHSYLKNFRSGT